MNATIPTPTPTQPPVTNSPQDLALAKAKGAIAHALNAICDDPKKYWLLGSGTETWERLTEAHALLWAINVEQVRKEFQPDPGRYKHYEEERERDRRLLDYCRDNHIKAS
jgi:hypothetical protein